MPVQVHRMPPGGLISHVEDMRGPARQQRHWLMHMARGGDAVNRPGEPVAHFSHVLRASESDSLRSRNAPIEFGA